MGVVRPDCGDCGGTGSAPSFAPQLFNHPIVAVTVDDRRPAPREDGATGWFWQVNGFERILTDVGAGSSLSSTFGAGATLLAGGPDELDYVLPVELFDRLDKNQSTNVTRLAVTYPTARAAAAALDAAALTYGREAFVESRKPKPR
jgi:hypothetical protein